MDNSLLTTISFSKVFQWDVKQFFFKKVVSRYPTDKLGNHLIHQTEKVQLSDNPDTKYKILGVSNKIGMFDANIEKGRNIKQKYHIVKENWIAYNPYRINVGSIGIKTKGLSGEYISPAYVVFSCKETLLPEYLWLMLKSDYFNKLIRDSTTGSVRQTLHYDKLAEIEAPIPSVNAQEKLLREYHNTLDEAEKNRRLGDERNANLLNEIQSEVSTLGRETSDAMNTASILQTTKFSSTSRWEVDFILKEGTCAQICKSFRYPCYSISQVKKESLFGLSLKASNKQKDGTIPMIRMSNIIDGTLDTKEMKYLPYNCAITNREPRKWLLQKGDLLINRTNSKELVGKTAVFDLDGDYTYASYVIRYRFDTNMVIPEYINILFMLPIVREQIDAMSRQTAGQCNINSDEIGSIRIPVPSTLKKQQELVDLYNRTKNVANEYYRKANELQQKADSDFQAEIFNM